MFRRFAPPSPSGAVFRRCGRLWACPRASAASRPQPSDRDGNAFLRFAPTLNSAWSFHCARKLACGSPCFIGLTTACFRHWRRPSCAPALRLRGVPCLRTSCARHFSPSGLHLFASVCSTKNARNDVHAVISDLSLVLPMLCQCSGILPGRAKTYIECTLPSIGDTHCGKWECSAHPPSKDPWP